MVYGRAQPEEGTAPLVGFENHLNYFHTGENGMPIRR
jgi:hypothetical protein